MSDLVRLNKTDLAAIEYEVAQLVGDEPTLEGLKAEGYRETVWLNNALDWIASAGRVVTLLVAELIQAAAALVIAVVFAVLEFWRVQHGAEALGQVEAQAALIAFAVVTANIVHPIYALRQLRGQTHLNIVKMTARGYVEVFWRRAVGKPVVEQADLYHNPTLHLAAAVITWSTVVLAVYDILGPLLTEIANAALSRPLLIAIMELIMGLGLSIAGVFFLQSAAHEIGVRTLTDQPARLTDVLERRRAEHAAQVEQARADVRARYMAAKIAEQERRRAETVNPTQPPLPMTLPTFEIPNGNGNGHGGHAPGEK